jgi:rhodanese-related sulfurtransferase
MARHHSPRFLAIVDDAKTRIKQISAEGLRARLEGSNTFRLIDVREADEYAAGHIAGAKHLCKGILERDIETTVPDPQTEIILYCGGGFRSALAADNMQKMGYTRVSSLAGGWRGWLEAGYPMTKN